MPDDAGPLFAFRVVLVKRLFPVPDTMPFQQRCHASTTVNARLAFHVVQSWKEEDTIVAEIGVQAPCGAQCDSHLFAATVATCPAERRTKNGAVKRQDQREV